MKYTAYITKVGTGETREYHDECEDAEDLEYQWSEGNYACDCNRALFFARSAGDNRDLDVGCSYDKYSVVVELDGLVIHDDCV